MIYQIMYYGGIVASSLFFLLLLFLFWRQKVFRIICDLTGISAQKTIKQIKRNGVENRERTKKKEVHVRSGNTTQKLSEIDATTVLETSMDTTVLQETTISDNRNNNFFEMITDIMELHSEEVIQ